MFNTNTLTARSSLIVFLSLLIFTTPAFPVEPFAATPEEKAMCNAVFRSSLDRQDKNSGHMHHYCDGLRFLNRAYSSMNNKKKMKYNAERSVSGCDYVLGHTTPDYFMRGDVHVVKSKALKLLGKDSESLAELHQALKYKKSAEEAFTLISDAYKKLGNQKKALEIATEGLRNHPESENLKKRYTDLGGTQPYPEAFFVNKQTETKDKSDVEKVINEEGPKGIASVDSLKKEIKRDGKEASPSVTESETKIGTKNNPYCRFCPDQSVPPLKQ